MNQNDSGKTEPAATMVYRKIFIDSRSAADYPWQWICVGKGSGVPHEWK